jgi:hypothetical protein
MTSTQEYKFEDSVWPMRGALDWIAYRNPPIIGDPVAPRASARYGPGRPKHCDDPERALLEQLRKGQLTAYKGDKPLPPEFWFDKDWLFVRRASGLFFWRNALLAVWPPILEIDKSLEALPGWENVEPKIMTSQGMNEHLLLWDAAFAASRESGQTPEWHWLRLIYAFLQGDLTDSGLVHFYPTHDAFAPRAYQHYSADDFRAAIELRAGLATLTIEALMNWGWKEFSELPEFSHDEPWRSKEYFVERDPDGRFGLAILRAELDHWLKNLKALNAATPVTPATTLATADRLRTSPVKERRRGPVPGTVDRYGEDDRKLFGELERIKSIERISIAAAAKKLADAYKIAGPATAESRATRLAKRYRQEKGSQNSL